MIEFFIFSVEGSFRSFLLFNLSKPVLVLEFIFFTESPFNRASILSPDETA